jgi:hypothetical protein
MPTSAAIVVTGLDEIIAGLRALPAQVGSDVRESLRPVLRDMKGRLATYPGERVNQRYRRTGKLGRGWVNTQERYIVRSGGGIDLLLTNPVDYVDRVQGDDQDIWFIGRWETASAVLTSYEQDITVAVEDGVVAAMRRLALL